MTLHLNNLDQQPLTLNITITGSGKTRTQTNVVGAAARLDVDKLSGGDTVSISSDGYDTVNLTAE